MLQIVFQRKVSAFIALAGSASALGALFAAGVAWSMLPGWRVDVVEPEPGLSVEAVDSAEAPARAAIEWFVPSLAGNLAFERQVAAALVDSRSRAMAARARETRDELAFLRAQLAASGLPDVWVGIPYVESKMSPDVVSPQCAGGYWQFLPEIAVNEGLRVSGCVLKSSSKPAPIDEVAFGDADLDPATIAPAPPKVFSPGRKLPGRGHRPYLGSGSCKIQRCAVDERRDFRRSTHAALRHLERLSELRWVRENPHQVALTLLAFNAGSGGAQRFVDAVGDADPFEVAASCATGDCLVLSREAAMFVPRVVATAAVVACNGADPGVPELSDWSRSGLCEALHRARLAPAPVSDREALVAAAARGDAPWRIGLAALRVEPGVEVAQSRRIDAWLLSALHHVDGVEVVPGVPGETPEELAEQGADVVLTGTLGRRDGLVWVRLERWSSSGTVGEEAAFSFVDPAALRNAGAESLLADALLRPLRDRRDGSISAIIRSRGDTLARCFPPVIPGQDEPTVTLGVQLDSKARASLDVDLPPLFDGERKACVESELAALRFPRELAGAGATLELAVEAPVVASSEDADSFDASR